MKIDTDDIDPAALLFAIVMSKLPKKHQEKIAMILEDMVFPWYEAATGQYAESDKSMRNIVTEKLEHDFSSVDWVVKDHSIPLYDEELFDESDFADEGDEDTVATDDPTLIVFSVVRVFSQSAVDGYHDVKVVVAPKEDRAATKELALSEFLLMFKPVEGMTVRSFDA